MGHPIPEGYELLSGRSRANAVTALATAQRRGLEESSVLTVRDGYLIPLGDSVLEAEVEEVELPTEKNTHDELDAFAAEHNVDFEGVGEGDKPTKAEKVAHINMVFTERAKANDEAAANGEPVGSDQDKE